MKILFLGSVIKNDDCTKFLGPSVAGNKMQLGILKGLKKFNDDITIVTEIPIATYPRERKIFVKSSDIEISDDIYAKVVPFLNIFVVKQISMIICSFLIILEWAIKNRDERMFIVTFNPFPYISIPAVLISKIFKLKTVCIFADPPIEAVSRGFFGKIAKKFETKVTEKFIKKYDGIVALNKKAVEKYSPDSKYIVVDGGFEIEDKPDNQPGGQWLEFSEGDIIDIVFSGGLYEYNGLVNLIRAFETIKNTDLRLNIYGEGPLKEFVINSSKKDYRIIYKGNVSNNEMLLIQQKAGILINPRPISAPMSLYTFPSKIIEYMLSGTPVITSKLNGLTNEYLENVFVMNDNSIKEITECIEQVTKLENDQLINKAINARAFIVNNKEWSIQSRKIYNFISELSSQKGKA